MMRDLPASTVADALLEVLCRVGAKVVFGVPGGAIEPFYDGVARAQRRGAIRNVVTRSESGAVFMAHGYVKESGHLAVVCATSGPGCTNLVTGAATALAEQIPMILVTGSPAMTKFGGNPMQDSSDVGIVDSVRMMAGVTKYSSLVSSPAQLINKLAAALSAAMTVPRGPVHLSIPSDVMRSDLLQLLPEQVESLAAMIDQVRTASPEPDLASVAGLFARLSASKAPVAILGERAIDAQPELLDFLERTGIPAVVTSAGIGALPWAHPSFRGVYGFGGHKSATKVFEGADLVIAVGLGMRELDTSCMDESVFNRKLVCVDNQLSPRAYMASLHVVADVRKVFRALQRYPYRCTYETAAFEVPTIKRDHEQTPNTIHPADFFSQLDQLLPKGTVPWICAGNGWSWQIHHAPVSDRLSKPQIAMGMGAMGWAISAATGAKLARPEAPILSIAGDGAWLMSSLELSTAVAEKIGVVYVCLNDLSLGMVRHGQMMGGSESIGHEIPEVDFARMAEAVGARGIRCRSMEEVRDLDWHEMLSRDRPTVVELMICGAAVPPMADRMKSLGRATPGM